MGCDIHVYLERKSKYNAHWHSADFWMDEADDDYSGGKEGEEERKAPEPRLRSQARYGRDYGLFALLAGVRGDEALPQVAPQRGLPSDMSFLVAKEAEIWKGDAHSCTWFMLPELVEFFEQHPTIAEEGFVSPAAAKDLDEKGELPRIWAGDVNPDYVDWVYRKWDRPSGLGPLLAQVDRIIAGHPDRLPVGETKEMKKNRRDRYGEYRLVIWFDN